MLLPATRRRTSRSFDDNDVGDSSELGFDDLLYPPGSRPAIAVGEVLVQACASTRDHIFAIRARSGGDLDVSTAGSVPWAPAPHDSSTVYIESAPGTATTVVQPDGRGVLVVHEAGKGVVAYDVDRAQTSGAIAAHRIEAPKFVHDCGPTWVVELIAEHAQTGQPFDVAVALGAYARLADAPDDNPTAAISLLLAGLPDPDTRRAQAWFVAQPTRFQDAVVAAAIAHAYALSDALDAIHQRALSGDRQIQRAVTRVAVSRDDLECARVLLEAKRPADPAIPWRVLEIRQTHLCARCRLRSRSRTGGVCTPSEP